LDPESLTWVVTIAAPITRDTTPEEALARFEALLHGGEPTVQERPGVPAITPDTTPEEALARSEALLDGATIEDAEGEDVPGSG
jgi:hypothetical protein